MNISWLSRLAVVTAAAGTLFVSSPAWADGVIQININPGNVPSTAAGFDSHDCGDAPFANIKAGQDGWFFVLPNDGEFDELFLTFQKSANPNDTIKVSIPPGNTPGVTGGLLKIGNGDQVHAWLITPAGWTLTGGIAEVTGTDAGGKFNLSHTCVGGGAQPSGSASSSHSGSPSASSSGSHTQPGTPGSSSSSGSSLPVTGTAIGGFVIAGTLLVAGGATLIVLRRRRDATSIN
jgi:LPXTG-motif cell wall-anchored protein